MTGGRDVRGSHRVVFPEGKMMCMHAAPWAQERDNVSGDANGFRVPTCMHGDVKEFA